MISEYEKDLERRGLPVWQVDGEYHKFNPETDIYPEVVVLTDNTPDAALMKAYMKSTDYKNIDTNVRSRADYLLDVLQTDPKKLSGYEGAATMERRSDDFSGKVNTYVHDRASMAGNLTRREGIKPNEVIPPTRSNFMNTTIYDSENYRAPIVKFK